MTTHYTEADAIIDRRGNTRAVCGRRVNEKAGETSLEPTCEQCQQYLQARDEEPLPVWATEKWGSR